MVLVLVLIFVTTAFSAFMLGMNRYNPRRITWEYRVVSVWGEGYARYDSVDAYNQDFIDLSEPNLVGYGNEGWELAGCFLEMETAFPNFGNEDYVTGIRDNVRPQRLVLIFKRPVEAAGI